MRVGNLGTDLRLLRGPLSLVLDAGQLLLQPHLQIAAEFYVGAAARHVGGDRYRPQRTRLRHDLRLLFMEARVQHRVRHLLLLQQLANRLALFDRGGADQHRLPALAGVLDQ